MFLKKKRSVTILGSCCSRDIFEYLDKASYDINLYIARTKLVSQLAPPYLPSEDIALSSSFQRRLVLNDLEKAQWKDLRASAGDCCIVDYIDERFKLIKIRTAASSTYITKSNELVSSGFLNGKDYSELQYESVNGKWTVDSTDLVFYLEQFLRNILELYRTKKIILHKAYMTDSYISGKGAIQPFSKAVLANNQQVNAMLRYLYSYTEEFFNKYHRKFMAIHLCDRYLASETHKWGLSPMHYQEGYYQEAAKLVKRYFSLSCTDF